MFTRPEGKESLTVALGNPTGGAMLGAPSTATVEIDDGGSSLPGYTVDDPETFVRQHYYDFLNRRADPVGLIFWRDELVKCFGDAGCMDVKRTNVSQAFFLSIEFQRTGYEVIRVYRASSGDSAQHPRGLPRYREFLRDTQELQRDVIVGEAGWEQQIPSGHGGATVRRQALPELGGDADGCRARSRRRGLRRGGTDGRAAALLSVTDSGTVYNRRFNPAAVLMQYFGYLRRNPSDAPEPTLDFTGYDFWLTKLDSFSRSRSGPPGKTFPFDLRRRKCFALTNVRGRPYSRNAVTEHRAPLLPSPRAVNSAFTSTLNLHTPGRPYHVAAERGL
ncbi:MAG TPA: hypothetical protein VF591_25975 [Pyrinomonadaceae bacterium]|jgi:hypothetical protein